MPNIENLKKQAKQILRWHRDGHYPVAALIREHLPRFTRSTDREILDAAFRLADAQELVACREGYANWEALRRGVEPMVNSPITPEPGPRLLQAEPQLFVTDLAATCEFYKTKLGFSVAFTYGDPPFYAQVMRDGARLNLRCVADPVVDPARAVEEDLLAASITVRDVKALFLEFQAAEAEFHQNLRTEPWGARTFIVRDPDGNMILFAG